MADASVHAFPDNRHRDQLRGYAICTIARSGSNYLSSLLASTGALGNPDEYFNGKVRRERGLTDYPLEPLLQLDQVLKLGATPNGIYAVKILAYQVEALRATKWSEVLPNLSFVVLERDDLLGQAVSLVRAQQTEQWRSYLEAKTEPRYDGPAIMAALRNAALDQARWRYWFARTGLEPLRLRYDQVVDDPQGAVDAVAALVGLEERALINRDLAPPLGIQRDETSAAWRERFVRETGDRSVF